MMNNQSFDKFADISYMYEDQRRYALVLNDYQVANLLWLIKQAWDTPANNGDWIGEIRWALESFGVTFTPNAEQG